VAAKTFQAGDSIESKCNKCKELRDHAIVVMVDGEIGKVQCKVCGSVHKHRSTTAKPKRTTKAVAARSAKALKEAQQTLKEWEEGIAKKDPKKAKPFGGKNSVIEGGLIKHKVFGLGIIQKVIPPTKMEVLFESGRKLMVQSL
jgi:hypothetical protein